MHNWITKAAESKPAAEVAQRAAPAPGSATSVVIDHLQIVQPPRTGRPLRFDPDQEIGAATLRSDEPIALAIHFKLSGPGAADSVRKRPQYRAKFYARDLATAARIHLGDSTPDSISEDRMSYTTMPHEVSCPRERTA